MKRLLIIDFDNTITDWNDRLGKKRADAIATKILFLKHRYHMEPMILSVANRAHIFGTIQDSGSKKLFHLMEMIPMITEEYRGLFQKLIPFRGETKADKDRVIMSVLKDKKFLNNQDCIRAYKKVNSLCRISRVYHIKPSDMFFLDDNWFNIKFATHFGFRALLVDNKKEDFTIFQRFHEIKNILTYNKEQNG